jgi:hypothetical protein
MQLANVILCNDEIKAVCLEECAESQKECLRGSHKALWLKLGLGVEAEYDKTHSWRIERVSIIY